MSVLGPLLHLLEGWKPRLNGLNALFTFIQLQLQTIRFPAVCPPHCLMGQACLATHLTCAPKSILASPPNWRARRAGSGEGGGGIGWRLRLYMDTLNYTPSLGERDDPPPAQVQAERGGGSRAVRGKSLNLMKDKEGTLGWKGMRKKSLNEVSNSVHGGDSR